jgi:hypothetical protein
MKISLIISAVLMILLAVAHTLWGEVNIHSSILGSDLGSDIKTTIYLPWYQMGWMLLLFGAVQLATVFYKSGKYARIVAAIAAIQILGNMLIVGINLMIYKQFSLIRLITPQFIMFIILVALLAYGVVHYRLPDEEKH